MTAGVPIILGLHHLKVPVSDLARSRDWYERLLGVRLAVELGNERKGAPSAQVDPDLRSRCCASRLPLAPARAGRTVCGMITSERVHRTVHRRRDGRLLATGRRGGNAG